MCAQTIGEQVRWQDLQVRSETDIIFDIAKREGWEDCEVFGSGDMITQPQESKGWKLIPADQYKYSIPIQAVARLHQVINAGVRVQGVIIADDTRREELTPVQVKPEEHETIAPPVPASPEAQAMELVLPEEHRTEPPATPARPRANPLAATEPTAPFAGEVVYGLIRLVMVIAIVAGAIAVAVGVIFLISLVGRELLHFWPVLPIGLFLLSCAGSSTGTGSQVDYDPKLVILVEDGKGGTAWISLFTWYD
jgi:hypothetical protein